jgi:hypothetical protein
MVSYKKAIDLRPGDLIQLRGQDINVHPTTDFHESIGVIDRWSYFGNRLMIRTAAGDRIVYDDTPIAMAEEHLDRCDRPPQFPQRAKQRGRCVD